MTRKKPKYAYPEGFTDDEKAEFDEEVKFWVKIADKEFQDLLNDKEIVDSPFA